MWIADTGCAMKTTTICRSMSPIEACAEVLARHLSGKARGLQDSVGRKKLHELCIFVTVKTNWKSTSPAAAPHRQPRRHLSSSSLYRSCGITARVRTLTNLCPSVKHPPNLVKLLLAVESHRCDSRCMHEGSCKRRRQQRRRVVGERDTTAQAGASIQQANAASTHPLPTTQCPSESRLLYTRKQRRGNRGY